MARGHLESPSRPYIENFSKDGGFSLKNNDFLDGFQKGPWFSSIVFQVGWLVFQVGWPLRSSSPFLSNFPKPLGAEEKALKAETEKVLVEKTTAFEEGPG